MSIKTLHRNIYTRIFIAVFFIIFQTGKQPKCLSIGKWVNKLKCSYTMGYCLAIKKDETDTYDSTDRTQRYCTDERS